MKKDFQSRDKFFYVSPSLFGGKWNYKSRLAIGMKFSDFAAMNSETYRFKVRGIMYEIDAQKARELGTKYQLQYGSLPNLLPIEEFSHYIPEKVEKKQLSLV